MFCLVSSVFVWTALGLLNWTRDVILSLISQIIRNGRIQGFADSGDLFHQRASHGPCCLVAAGLDTVSFEYNLLK
jgi:hypothetical protein